MYSYNREKNRHFFSCIINPRQTIRTQNQKIEIYFSVVELVSHRFTSLPRVCYLGKYLHIHDYRYFI